MARRELVVDTAIDVLGRSGMRGLTHRVVDRTAGLPEGSTSNLFRTREALLGAVASRVAERDRELWRAVAPGRLTGRADLIDALAAWLDRALTAERNLTAARYALFLAAADNPTLRGALEQSRSGIEAWAGGELAAAGLAADALATILDQLDGLLLHQLCFPRAGFDPRPSIERIVPG
ncbi:TetR/AcrR family transcriptional regulator [Naumannella huperziae]